MRLKNFLSLLVVFILISLKSVSQEDKNIVIKTSGYGSSLELARNSAIKSAFELTCNAFLSLNNKTINSLLLYDNIDTITINNFLNYEVLAEESLSDGNFLVLVESKISSNKLINYMESKGDLVSFNGGLFVMNIIQQKLNEESEYPAIEKILTGANALQLSSFNYLLEANEPISVNSSNDSFLVKITVKVNPNENFIKLSSFLKDNLIKMSMKEIDIQSYQKLNKFIYYIVIDEEKYAFRTQESFELIRLFFRDFIYAMRNFHLFDNVSSTTGHQLKYLTLNSNFRAYGPHFDERYLNWKSNGVDKEFPVDWEYLSNSIIDIKNAGVYNLNHDTSETLVKYNFILPYNLSNISKVTSYKIEPLVKTSNIGKWAEGGRVAYEWNNALAVIPYKFIWQTRLPRKRELGYDEKEKQYWINKLGDSDFNVLKLKIDTILYKKTPEQLFFNTSFDYFSGFKNTYLLDSSFSYPATPEQIVMNYNIKNNLFYFHNYWEIPAAQDANLILYFLFINGLGEEIKEEYLNSQSPWNSYHWHKLKVYTSTVYNFQRVFVAQNVTGVDTFESNYDAFISDKKVTNIYEYTSFFPEGIIEFTPWKIVKK
jgi:hypothetical protein